MERSHSLLKCDGTFSKRGFEVLNLGVRVAAESGRRAKLELRHMRDMIMAGSREPLRQLSELMLAMPSLPAMFHAIHSNDG